jgi:subtilase family serine protease
MSYKTKLVIPAVLSAMALVVAPLQVGAAPVTKVTLTGNQAISATHGVKLGHKKTSDKVSFTLALKMDNAAIDAFVADLYNPASPNYKKFLTPDQFATKFAPSQEAVNQVTDFAKAQGLNVDEVTSDHKFVKVSGSVDQVEKAFDITINDYQNSNGDKYFANASEPMVPDFLQNIISGVHGLSSEAKYKHASVTKPSSFNQPFVAGKPNTATAHAGSGPSGGYTPTELRSAYDIAPLNSAGYNGTGQSVALMELDGYSQTNITQFVNYYGLGSPTPSKILVDGYNGAAGSGQIEVELDIEVINAIAPKANVAVYEGPNTGQGLIDVYQKIANDNTSKSISVSWGICEAQSTTAEMNSLHTIFSQYASQGQSIFDASGDDGAYDCGTTALAVDSPANDPYVTGVGGTNLTLSGGSYSSEKVWSNTSTSPKSGGGGGLSTVYAKPTWQTGTGTTNSYSNGKRQVPDVSAAADPATGYSVYSAGSWTSVGGTSAAAPLWAGIAAINNQYALANGKAVLGQANPTLYKMFNTTQTYPAFHDITTGTNLYYPATAGYDLATGIGTPDAYNLIRDINGVSSGGGGGTPTELVKNGGFESTSTNWTETSSGGYEIVDSSKPHTGTSSAYLCGYNSCTDTIAQTVTIPSTATSATLSYWTNVSTTETTHSYDYLYAQLKNSAGTVLTTLQTQSDATATGWVKNSYDVSAYKGQTITVYFKATNDTSNATSFYLDDVSLQYQ